MDVPVEIVAKIERHNAIRAEIAAVSERLEPKMPRAASEHWLTPKPRRSLWR
jgi:hypothetical protein